MKNNNSYTKGEWILISAGEYDTYKVLDCVIVIKPFNIKELVAEYFKNRSDQLEIYHFDLYEFFDFIMKKGVVKKYPHRCLHLGHYGTINKELLKND